MLIKVTGDTKYAERNGTHQTTVDGELVWCAFIQLGRHREWDGAMAYIVVEALGPSEVQAAERCMTKCKLLGDCMTLAIQEGFWAPLRRAEAASRSKVFSAALGRPTSIIKADDDDDDGKGQPS